MNYYKNITAKKIKPYIGSMNQLARIRTSVLDDGKGRGIRIADVDNGSGLRFSVLLDRGMDIGDASFHGVPFAYMTPGGIVNPAFFESTGFDWLRSFGAGLLTGCGLRNVGAPVLEEDVKIDGPLGLHGRLSNTPAENISITQDWVNDKFQLTVSGLIRESSFFSENLELYRTISTVMGDNTIVISDKVINKGVRPAPLMLLYHINAGFPLLDKTSVLDGNVKQTVPRDVNAAKGLDNWRECQVPTAGYIEQCFYHDIEADQEGMARMTIRNENAGMALEVAYRKEELPFFTQWKQMGQQEYVMGMEPANCHPEGQSKEAENGTLQIIQPDEIVEFKVVISLKRSPLS